MSTKSAAPSTGAEFDKIYSSPLAHWVWSDIRIPKELSELVKTNNPQTSLELGCGLGRFSGFMAGQGIKATGIDLSAVAIEKAKMRVANIANKPTLITGDVTNLQMLTNPFDVSFDVGCFHCLNEEAQYKYAGEVYRLLKPGGTHLIWALDHSPSDIDLSPNYMTRVFEKQFKLVDAKFSRRRIIASHWYWFVRNR